MASWVPEDHPCDEKLPSKLVQPVGDARRRRLSGFGLVCRPRNQCCRAGNACSKETHGLFHE